uniref:THAP-type domain-containing protein n=1 Tax=Rhabditophanes sp. KR3021 TaxID=114890 RepID=A0AC35TYA8_9BILA
MGCVSSKFCSPSLPDKSIRDYWHVEGVILDDQLEGKLVRRPSGVLYVFNGNLEFRSQVCFTKKVDSRISMNICNIQSVSSNNKFTSLSNGKCISEAVVEISSSDPTGKISHIAFITNKADLISQTLKSICDKHRQKPRIFQFNSIDVEGIEIELP